MLIKISWIFGVLLITLLISRPAIAADEDKIYTNNDIYQLFERPGNLKNTHSVMVEQRDRINAILNAFLLGDKETINTQSYELLKAMNEIVQTQPLTTGAESNAWQAMSKIVQETHLLIDTISENDYKKAYIHFSNIPASCIQCHQAVREWGKFPKSGIKGAALLKVSITKDSKPPQTHSSNL